MSPEYGKYWYFKLDSSFVLLKVCTFFNKELCSNFITGALSHSAFYSKFLKVASFQDRIIFYFLFLNIIFFSFIQYEKGKLLLKVENELNRVVFSYPISIDRIILKKKIISAFLYCIWCFHSQLSRTYLCQLVLASTLADGVVNIYFSSQINAVE